LLAAPAESIEAKFKELDALDEQLAKERVPAPIDVATRLRADCLRELVEVRRARTATNPQGTTGDEFFVKLSTAELLPSRDDRGISVTVRDAFSGSGLSAHAHTELKKLEAILKGEASLSVLVVIHGANSNLTRDGARGREAVAVLKQMGASKTDMQIAGDRLPLVERGKPGAVERNERLEVVFLVPAT
jgi:hypothetical protein